MDDDFGADEDFLAALAATPVVPSRPNQQASRPQQPAPPRLQQPAPQRIQPGAQRVQQPTPQRLDKAPPSAASASGPKVVQPTPQALPGRSAGSSILVSPRQKGNPVLANLKSVPWEYSDIPADYGLGLTTCALFLSLKYHRLHPEYIYTRIQKLQGKYALRVVLTMVDIPNHEDSLRELSKTSVVNNVTIILCWSAAEAARYLELYKSYENHAGGFAAIRGQQATGYAERLVEFVTVPRAINKADAVALVGTFGSLKNAINADPETIGVVGGWGEKKVKAWRRAVDEPFRVKKAAARGKGKGKEKEPGQTQTEVPLRDMVGKNVASGSGAERVPVLGVSARPEQAANRDRNVQEDNFVAPEDEEAMIAAATEASKQTADIIEPPSQPRQRQRSEELDGGIAAALARLREKG